MKKLPEADKAIQMLKQILKDNDNFWFYHSLKIKKETIQSWIKAPSKLTKVDILLIKMLYNFPYLIAVAINRFSEDGLDKDSQTYKDFKFKSRILT